MSLMNDALRKKKSEKKTPSSADFLKDDADQRSKSKVTTYGIAVIALLVCAMGGFFLYEYLSLSRPMTPVQAPPVVARSETPPANDSTPPKHVSQEATSSERGKAVEAPVKPSDSEAETASAAPVYPKSDVSKEAQEIRPAEADEAPRVQKATVAEASRQITVSPASEIEPEENLPPVEVAEKESSTGLEKEKVPVESETDPVEERFYRKGLSYHRQSNLEMAVRMYRAVLKKNPDHRPTRFNLASAYIQINAFTEAKSLLDDLHRQEPENPEVLLNLAVVELGLNRPDQALDLLDEAEKRFTGPKFEVLFHRGAAHSRMGDFEESLTMYRKAQKLHPDHPRLILNVAIAYDNLKQFDEAIDHYQLFLDRSTAQMESERQNVETRVRELKRYIQ